jgi:MoxR-like ATPase
MGVINRLASLGTSHPPEPVKKFLEASGSIILGKTEQLELALCTVLARGHLLIEDIPGVGKTTLVKLMGRALGLKQSRIQFTNDMLPADILGASIYDENLKKFVFHKGPLFGQIVIADELNRATPKPKVHVCRPWRSASFLLKGLSMSCQTHFYDCNPEPQRANWHLHVTRISNRSIFDEN